MIMENEILLSDLFKFLKLFENCLIKLRLPSLGKEKLGNCLNGLSEQFVFGNKTL